MVNLTDQSYTPLKDTAQVELRCDNSGDTYSLILEERNPGRYSSGIVSVVIGNVDKNDDVLQCSDGDNISLVYTDPAHDETTTQNIPLVHTPSSDPKGGDILTQLPIQYTEPRCRNSFYPGWKYPR